MIQIRYGHYTEVYYGAYEVIKSGNTTTKMIWFYLTIHGAKINDHEKSEYMVKVIYNKGKSESKLSVYANPDEWENSSTPNAKELIKSKKSGVSDEEIFDTITQIFDDLGVTFYVLIMNDKQI